MHSMMKFDGKPNSNGKLFKTNECPKDFVRNDSRRFG